MIFIAFIIFLLQNGSHLWQLALQKRKEGRCPLEPGEVAVILRAMGYPKETQIYVASGQVYGGQNRMAPLRNMFPNLVRSLPLFRMQYYFSYNVVLWNCNGYSVFILHARKHICSKAFHSLPRNLL